MSGNRVLTGVTVRDQSPRSRDPSNATKLIARLKKQGIPATARTFQSNGKQLSRVIAGPFNDRAARDKAQRVIRGMGLKDAVPVRR